MFKPWTAAIALTACFAAVAASDEAPPRWSVAIPPLHVEEGGPALGLAAQAVLQAMLQLHPQLSPAGDMTLFATEGEFREWLAHGGRMPKAAEVDRVRYLLTGRVTTGDPPQADVTWLDSATGQTVEARLPLDAPGLRAFRTSLLDLLERAGVPVPEAQRADMLWPESLTPAALHTLGDALLAEAVASYADRPPDDGPARRLLSQAPGSYLALVRRGWVLEKRQKHADARALFERALQVNPTGADAASGLETVASSTGDADSEDHWILKRAEIEGRETTGAWAYVWSRRGDRARHAGDLERAADAYRRSLAIGPGNWLRVLASLSDTLTDLGRFEEAGALWEQERPRLEGLKFGPRFRDKKLLSLQLSWGKSLLEHGHPDESIAHSQEALALARALGDLGEATALSNIGAAQTDLGRYADAIASREEALRLLRAAGRPAVAAVVMNNLAATYETIGDQVKALALLKEALDIARRQKDRELGAWVLLNTATSQSALGHYDAAIKLAEQATALYGQLNDRRGKGLALRTSGWAHHMLGEWVGLSQLGDAVSLLARQADRAAYADTLAMHSLLQLDPETDRKSIRQALAIWREMKARDSEAAGLAILMNVERTAGRPWLAIFYGKQSVNAFQSVRGELRALPAELKHTFLGTRAFAYRLLADLLIEAGRLPEAQQVLDLLKEEEYAEFVRRDAGTGPGLASLTPAEAEWERQYREASERVVALGAERGPLLGKAKRSSEDDERLAALDRNLSAAGQAFQEFLDGLGKQLAGTPRQEKLAELREAQGLMENLRELGPGAVAVYTLVTDDRLRLMLVTPDATRAYEAPIGAVELARKIAAFRELLQDAANRATPRDPLPLARELYRLVVSPLAADLETARAETVMWSLDGPLRYLPIAALHDGQRYLVERFRNVVFTPASHARLKDQPQPAWRALGLGVSKAHEDFAALPGAAAELHDVVRDSDGGRGVLPGVLELDEQFTFESMRSGLRERYPLVHIASHFAFLPGDEARSFLLLGDGQHLPLSELRALPNLFGGVDLLTLSACQTAVGGSGADGREVEGFAVLAQRQGAKAVVASLWPVSDASTRELMREFYRLREARPGTSKAEALQHAQLRLLRGLSGADSSRAQPTAPFAHPYYWAPFILIGNWR